MNNTFIKDDIFREPKPFETLEEEISNGGIQGNHIGKSVIRADNLVIGSKGHVSNAVWSTTTNSISWNSHTLILGDNTIYNISSGSASITNASLTYYLYYKKNSSTYRVSTIRADAIGNNKVLVNTVKVDSNGIVTFVASDNSGTQISGDNIKTGKIQSTDGKTFFDLNDGKLQISDASNPRVRLSSTSPYLVVSKTGQNANTSTPANSLMHVSDSGIKIYSTKTFSSPSNTNPNFYNWGTSSVTYSTSGGGQSTAIIIDFYKQSSWEILSFEIQLRFRPGAYFNGTDFSTTYQSNIKAYLNPSISSALGSYNAYYRYSGGTVLRMNSEGADAFSLSSSKLTLADTFSSSEISQISNGWNQIVLQTDNNNADDISFGVINATMSIAETVV